MQKNSINKDSNVVILDDILATGGTVKASFDLVKIATGKNPLGVVVLVEIMNLFGRDKVDCSLHSIIQH